MNNIIGIVQYFSLIFASIFLEALPFIIIGALVSAFIQTFLDEQLIKRVIPRNKILGGIIAAFVGMIFPVCECATVPIGRGLIKKGVPLNVAVTYMLATPIINPVVLMSTYYAFNGSIKVLLYRAGFGLIIAITVGYIIDILNGNSNVLSERGFFIEDKCNCGCSGYQNNKSKLLTILNHSSKELYDIGKYFIIGAALAALCQVLIPRDKLTMVGQNIPISIIVMMLFAFLSSLCSEADAFVASTFLGSFSLGAVMSFLILGPMIDLKNTVMLFSTFKKSFVFKLLFCIFSLCFIAACLIY